MSGIGDDSKPPSGDYEVGYGKPPKGTRFKQGNRGRPKGNKKAEPPSFGDAVLQAFNRKLTAKKADGGEITRSALEHGAEALANDFARADPGAVKRVIELAKLNGELTAAPDDEQGPGVIIIPSPYRGPGGWARWMKERAEEAMRSHQAHVAELRQREKAEKEQKPE